MHPVQKPFGHIWAHHQNGGRNAQGDSAAKYLRTGSEQHSEHRAEYERVGRAEHGVGPAESARSGEEMDRHAQANAADDQYSSLDRWLWRCRRGEDSQERTCNKNGDGDGAWISGLSGGGSRGAPPNATGPSVGVAPRLM